MLLWTLQSRNDEKIDTLIFRHTRQPWIGYIQRLVENRNKLLLLLMGSIFMLDILLILETIHYILH